MLRRSRQPVALQAIARLTARLEDGFCGSWCSPCASIAAKHCFKPKLSQDRTIPPVIQILRHDKGCRRIIVERHKGYSPEVEQACNHFLLHGTFPQCYEEMQAIPLRKRGPAHLRRRRWGSQRPELSARLRCASRDGLIALPLS